MSSEVPQHWQKFTGPSGWYTLAFPPGWDVQDEGGILSLSAPGQRGILSLRCSWLATPEQITWDRLLNLPQLFPLRRKVFQLRELPLPYASRGAGGEFTAPSKLTFWQRLHPRNWFQRPRWRRWRAWVVRHGHLCLCALFLHRTVPDPEMESVALMILQTLQLTDHPADPPDRFTERVLALAQKEFPDLPCISLPDFQVMIGTTTLNLANFYRSYVAQPDQFSVILHPALQTVVQLQNWAPAQHSPELDDVRARIMPMLYPADQWRSRFPGFVGTEWVGGLAVLYVVDEEHAYWYVRKELVDRWDINSEELYKLAVKNLERYFENSPMELTVVGEGDGPQIVLPNKPDVYNSCRWLSPHFRDSVQDILGREFAIGLPNRDFFVAVDLQWSEAVEQIRARVIEDFQRMDHPLTRHMLLVSSDGVSEYQPDDDDEDEADE